MFRTDEICFKLVLMVGRVRVRAQTHTHTHKHTADSWFLSVSGEAQYVNDLHTMPNEVYAAFCLTTVGQGYIANIDASEILVRYIVAKAQLLYTAVLDVRF